VRDFVRTLHVYVGSEGEAVAVRTQSRMSPPRAVCSTVFGVSPLRAVPACVRRLCTAPCSTYDHRPPGPQKPLPPPERAQCSAGRVRACTVCVSINGGQGSGERPWSFDYDTSLLTTCNDLGYEGVRGVPRDRPTGVPRS